MPCYDAADDSIDNSEIRAFRKRIKLLEACLCGVMTVNPKIVDKIDWKEVGITKEQHMAWWKQHQEEDAKRIAKKKEKQEKKLKQAKALEAAELLEYERLRKKFERK